MKVRILIFTLFVATTLAYAAEETASVWDKGGQGAVNFSQTVLSNWAGGGMNALSLNSFLSLYANYSKENLNWENTLDLAYGMLRQEGIVEKTDDKIDLASKLGYKAAEHWNYSGLLSLKTQMTPGYEDTVKISAFAAPGYLQLAAGMEYKPNKNFSLMMAPISGKITMLLDPDLAGKYGVDPSKKVLSEFGAYAKISYRNELIENVVFQTKCDLFMNYLQSPLHIDVNWDVLLSMKINKFLSASISTRLAYDYDYNEKLQFKETLGIGLSFSF
jgi:hypothetical protein